MKLNYDVKRYLKGGLIWYDIDIWRESADLILRPEKKRIIIYDALMEFPHAKLACICVSKEI